MRRLIASLKRILINQARQFRLYIDSYRAKRRLQASFRVYRKSSCAMTVLRYRRYPLCSRCCGENTRFSSTLANARAHRCAFINKAKYKQVFKNPHDIISVYSPSMRPLTSFIFWNRKPRHPPTPAPQWWPYSRSFTTLVAVRESSHTASSQMDAAGPGSLSPASTWLLLRSSCSHFGRNTFPA